MTTALVRFKKAIAHQLSKHTLWSSEEIMSFMRPHKHLKEGHIAIALPKLNTTQDIVSQFQTDDYIEEIQAHHSKLVFRFHQVEFIKQVLHQVYQDKSDYGWAHQPKQHQTVVIDYSSPNIAKPFHAGHLRSTILGHFAARIHQAFGYQVIGINYLGDWGKQYGLLAVGFDKYGDEEQLALDPIHHLYQVYVKINAEAKENPDIDRQANAYFKRMEEGDPESIKQWQQFRDMSIASYKEIYRRLGIKFDVYSGESQVNPFIAQAHQLLQQNQLLTQTTDGAWTVDLEPYQLGKVIVQRADGTSLYVTRDLASILMRQQTYGFQKALYVVGSEQAKYFSQLFKTANLMSPLPMDLQHIEFGRIQGMSTRQGTAVFLQDILDTAKAKIMEYMQNDEKKSQIKDLETIADQLGISAILIQDMKSKRAKDYKFSWDRMTDARGDTGVFLQYAHAKACGIERKSNVVVTSDVDYALLKEKEAVELVYSIAQFPEMVESALATLEPCTIVNYLFKLSHATSLASRSLRVKDMNPEIAKVRMLLFWSARMTLSNGLHLLGIKPIQHM
ncbi:uncharacterized protein B0P05DRAFT_560869 [Gilbertella persicaria]|uniref:arginine--tRNA ligase n=1 Tax=Rhizopus stolonifer TaxID=4846 RepID=A0A367KVA8_RHIST|nr:uncharacterized protein B0P05DRAFT_560869 [Gilbertella persicaria]KAI8054950.1 hypothetical protein B0P05DRAFT_560869 [Gilbertella persicaria]RCI06153.1 Arginyl-tRNA synthetase [Rhizopus stolonifer]